MFQRHQIVAGGHAGTAHHDHFIGGPAREQRAVVFAQRLIGHELAAEIEIVFVRGVDGAGDMAGDFVERFNIAGESFFGAGIQDQPVIGRQRTHHFVGIDHEGMIRRRHETRGLYLRQFRCYR